MAHFRKPLGYALTLNTTIVVGEIAAGIYSGSLSLAMDGIHNLSDELALAFLFLAYTLPLRFSKHLVRSANLFNSIGLIAVSGLLVWQAIERLIHPAPVLGWVAIVFGLGAALANWGVAQLLKGPAHQNPAIRLAYLHNQGDVLVSLAPVTAGLIVATLGYAWIDAAVALIVALWIIGTTLRELIASSDELIWPENATCGHDDGQSSQIMHDA